MTETLKAGDTARVVRDWECGENGTHLEQLSTMPVGTTGIVREVSKDSVDMCNYFWPPFVLEKITSGTVPEQIKGRGATCVVLDHHATLAGDSKMKTQEIYSVVVTENEHVKDAETTQIIATKKRVIYKESAMSAYSSGNAQVKAILAAAKVKGVTAIKDEDELEVKVSSPF